MTEFVERTEVTSIIEAMARLGVGDDYCVIVEPVRGWYYLHLCHRGDREGSRIRRVRSQLRGEDMSVLTDSIWQGEQEIGPVSGVTLRETVNYCRAQRVSLELPAMKVMVDKETGFDLATARSLFTQTHHVRVGAKVHTWRLGEIDDVTRWPDLE